MTEIPQAAVEYREEIERVIGAAEDEAKHHAELSKRYAAEAEIGRAQLAAIDAIIAAYSGVTTAEHECERAPYSVASAIVRLLDGHKHLRGVTAAEITHALNYPLGWVESAVAQLRSDGRIEVATVSPAGYHYRLCADGPSAAAHRVVPRYDEQGEAAIPAAEGQRKP